jgi:hypothetical protein
MLALLDGGTIFMEHIYTHHGILHHALLNRLPLAMLSAALLAMLFCFATKYTPVDINDLTATIKILGHICKSLV